MFTHNAWNNPWAYSTKLEPCHLLPYGNPNIYGAAGYKTNTLRLFFRAPSPIWTQGCNTPAIAQALDQKLDDGKADSGAVQGYTNTPSSTTGETWTDCLSGTRSPWSTSWGAADNADYDLTKTDKKCSIAIKM